MLRGTRGTQSHQLFPTTRALSRAGAEVVGSGGGAQGRPSWWGPGCTGKQLRGGGLARFDPTCVERKQQIKEELHGKVEKEVAGTMQFNVERRRKQRVVKEEKMKHHCLMLAEDAKWIEPILAKIETQGQEEMRVMKALHHQRVADWSKRHYHFDSHQSLHHPKPARDSLPLPPSHTHPPPPPTRIPVSVSLKSLRPSEDLLPLSPTTNVPPSPNNGRIGKRALWSPDTCGQGDSSKPLPAPLILPATPRGHPPIRDAADADGRRTTRSIFPSLAIPIESFGTVGSQPYAPDASCGSELTPRADGCATVWAKKKRSLLNLSSAQPISESLQSLLRLVASS